MRSKPNLSRDLRTRLGLSTLQWAAGLGVSLRTVERWEGDGVSPVGLVAEVLGAISDAIDSDGREPMDVGKLISNSGVRSILRIALMNSTRCA